MGASWVWLETQRQMRIYEPARDLLREDVAMARTSKAEKEALAEWVQDGDARDDALYQAIRGYLVVEGVAEKRAHRLALRAAQLVMAMAVSDG